MTLWLVRAGSRGEREDFALEHDLAVLSFREVGDLSKAESRNDVLGLLRHASPEEKPARLNNWAAQLWAFVGRMHPGDRVALPLKSRSAIAFGTVTGDYDYRASFPEDARHTRPVRWEQEISRTRIDQDLLYSFGAFLSVCRISRHDAEARIEALLAGKKPTPYIPVEEAEEPLEETSTSIDLESHARDQIREYIGRRFAGHDLAVLVDEVLVAQGYRTIRSPEGPDGGVDVLAGRGPMGFDAPRLCVQVKSGDTPSDVKVLRELSGVMKAFGADHGLIVSWGGFTSAVYKESRRHFFEVRLWDADDLVRAIQAHYDQLSDTLQAELPLKRTWMLVLEGE